VESHNISPSVEDEEMLNDGNRSRVMDELFSKLTSWRVGIGDKLLPEMEFKNAPVFVWQVMARELLSLFSLHIL